MSRRPRMTIEDTATVLPVLAVAVAAAAGAAAAARGFQMWDAAVGFILLALFLELPYPRSSGRFLFAYAGGLAFAIMLLFGFAIENTMRLVLEEALYLNMRTWLFALLWLAVFSVCYIVTRLRERDRIYIASTFQRRRRRR